MGLKKRRKVANTSSEFLDNLTEFFTNFEELSQEELKSELRDEGINPEELLSKVKLLVEFKLREAKKAWKKDAHEKRKFLIGRMSLAKYDIPKTPTEIRKKIKELLRGLYGSEIQSYAQAYFRNLDEVTEEDLKSFYEDIEKLKFLENKFKNDDIE